MEKLDLSKFGGKLEINRFGTGVAIFPVGALTYKDQKKLYEIIECAKLEITNYSIISNGEEMTGASYIVTEIKDISLDNIAKDPRDEILILLFQIDAVNVEDSNMK